MKSVSIHDMKTRQSAVIRMLSSIADPRAIPRAMKSMLNKYQRHRGGGSRYKPHQGEAECRRRRRQMRTGEYERSSLG